MGCNPTCGDCGVLRDDRSCGKSAIATRAALSKPGVPKAGRQLKCRQTSENRAAAADPYLDATPVISDN